ncbi:MAG: thioredoxin-disulfide reductase [Ignavibacteriales bacterium]|nr:thioredoxin-disulfide reductase [Ignavibacteriales bacterium]
MENHYDVIVIGAGPAGLTAGIYLARGKMKTLILNEGAVGGQTVLTHEIANYPGIEKISGFQLARNMKSQAVSFGCTIKSNINITKLSVNGDVKSVEVNGKDIFTSDSIILATGGKSRSLNVPGENEFKGKGISYCATCDGDFFQDKNIIVVGGGNSALEEAVSLTKYASSVTIVHQFDHFQAFPHAVEEAKNNPKIRFLMESKIIEFSGNEKLERVKIGNQITKEINEQAIDGVFILIGYEPNTQKLEGIVALNKRNEIIVDEHLQTSIPGVYAAGDSITKRYRQITTAVADGTIAALNSIEYINKKRANMAA